MSIWVLTEEYNDYDQYGEYFVHAWSGKPTWEELYKVLLAYDDEDYCDHVLKGGGRLNDNTHHWYWLKEFKPAC